MIIEFFVVFIDEMFQHVGSDSSCYVNCANFDTLFEFRRLPKNSFLFEISQRTKVVSVSEVYPQIHAAKDDATPDQTRNALPRIPICNNLIVTLKQIVHFHDTLEVYLFSLMFVGSHLQLGLTAISAYKSLTTLLKQQCMSNIYKYKTPPSSSS